MPVALCVADYFRYRSWHPARRRLERPARSSWLLMLVRRQHQLLQLLPPLSICFVFFLVFIIFFSSRISFTSAHIWSFIFTLYCFGCAAVITSPTNRGVVVVFATTWEESRQYDKSTENRIVGRQIMPLIRITLVNRIFKISITFVIYTVHTTRTNNKLFIFASGMLWLQIVATFSHVRGLKRGFCLVFLYCT